VYYAFVEMEQPVLYIVPEKFEVYAVGCCILSALVAVVALKLITAVFTYYHFVWV
jgi:hypothetical protein